MKRERIGNMTNYNLKMKMEDKEMLSYISLKNGGNMALTIRELIRGKYKEMREKDVKKNNQ